MLLSISISELLSSPSKNDVVVRGSVKSIDTQKTHRYLKVFDGSSSCELSVRLGPDITTQIAPWASVSLEGNWISGEKSYLDASEVLTSSEADPESNPLNNTTAGHSYPHLHMRRPWQALLMRFRSAAMSAIVDYFDNHPLGPFTQVHHPVITHTDCEGGAEVFPVLTQNSKKANTVQRDDFFGGRRYLTVTAAIHGEAFAMSLERVWMLAPCFRAERVLDSRHLAEFHMLEIAMNRIESLYVLCDLCEDFARGLVERLKKSAAGTELLNCVGTPETTMISPEELQMRWDLLTAPNWPRISHADAVILMQEAERTGIVEFQVSPEKEIDFSAEHEVFLLSHFKRPVFITHFPTRIRLFSALQSPPPTKPGEVQTTESLDLLLPGVAEVVSGGLREHRLDKLIEVMRAKGFFSQCDAKDGTAKGGDYPFLKPNESLDSLEWFADLRRWGTSPHGGVGLGFDRVLAYLTGVESVQDVVAFPRYYQTCEA